MAAQIRSASAASPTVGTIEARSVASRRISGVVCGAGTSPVEPAFVGDFDTCWLDHEALERDDQWGPVLHGGRLGSVSGAFAVAWRDADGAFNLARDHIGERSLFFARAQADAAGVDHALVFASDLRGVLASGLVKPVIDHIAVARYLSYGYLPGRDTLLRGVHKVQPAEAVRFRNGALSFDTLWSLPEASEPPVVDEHALRARLRSELEAAVARRLPPHGPVGASLSGGIDSSLVVAMARRLHRGDVHTYSVSFGSGYRNELPFSSMVAEHCGTRHHILELTPDLILRHLDDSIGLLGDPIGDPLTVPNALLFRAAAEDVDVMLNGEGGDPCFGGPKNLPMLLAELFGDGQDAYDDSSGARERTYLRAHQKCYDDLPKLLSSDVRASIADHVLERELTPLFADQRWSQFVAKLMAINLSFKGAFHILHKVDAVSAPFGVRPRSPLFDRAVVELAFQLPAQLKLRGSVEKYLLKEAVRDLLPDAIIDRPKSGMLVPVEAWFKGPLLGHARERLLDGLTQYGLFDRAYLERLLGGRLPGLHPRRGVKIWMLVTLESWLRSVGAK